LLLMKFLKRWLGTQPDQSPPASVPREADGQATETHALLTAVVLADPNNGEAHLGLGMLRLRDFAAEPVSATLHDAVGNLTRAVELLPDSPAAYFYLAFAESFTLDTIDQAAQHLARALDLDPALSVRAAEIQERIAAARTDMQEHAVDPATIHAAVQQYEQGHMLVQAERFDEAVAAFEQAITTYPAYAEALLALGETYRRLGRATEALGMFRRTLAVRPKMFEAHLGLGSLYVQQGEHQRALEQVTLAQEQAPDQPQVIRTVGLLQLAVGHAADAAATFRRLCALTPDDPEPRLHLALAALNSGNPAMAAEALSRIADAPLSAKQHQLAAQLYGQLGDAEAAQRHREQAV
jgi:tetratricopeptide (TPR) repeat protein